MRASLTKQQNMMVATLWVTYALFYLGRLNFSVVLPAIALDLQISRAEVGALGTAFFWVYGISHFFMGEIGSHISPFRIVSVGLLIIALANIAFAFQTSLIIMLALWGFNGIAQAAGWAPMLRILAERLDRAHLKRISTIMPFSYVFGTALTWTLIGMLTGGGDWRIGFWLPGLLLLLALAFWRRAGIDAPRSQSAGFRFADLFAEVRTISFALVTAALAGFVFNGTLIWLPSYILDSGLIPPHLVGVVAAVLQLIAAAGLLLSRIIVVRSGRAFPTTVLLFLVTALAFLLLTASDGALALVVVTFGLVTLNGAMGLVVSAMPLLLAPPGRAASVTGSVNMMSNFFGGLAGFTIGGLVEIAGWSPVFGLWAAALVIASAVLWWKRAEENRWAGVD